MLDIDYIVLTRNSERTLDQCLISIRKYANPRQIIVIDQNSTDHTLDIAKKHHCLVVRHKGLTIGAARRLGARVASTPVIAYVDHDVELISEWHPILEQDAGLISAHYKGDVPGGTGFGCSITRRDLILACDEMDTWGPQEDTVFQSFLKNHGWRIVNLSVDVVHHNVRSIEKIRWYGAWSRQLRGFQFRVLRQILGGALLGIRQDKQNDSYIQNWRVRMNYLLGYIFPDLYAAH